MPLPPSNSGIRDNHCCGSVGDFLKPNIRDGSNLIWILGGDQAPSTPEAVAVWRAMAKGITLGVSGREDDDRVLMTYHTSGPGHVSDYIHDEPWPDFSSAPCSRPNNARGSKNSSQSSRCCSAWPPARSRKPTRN